MSEYDVDMPEYGCIYDKRQGSEYMFHTLHSARSRYNLTLFRMGIGGDKKDPPTSFSPVPSTNIGISPQNFLTFSFNPVATLV